MASPAVKVGTVFMPAAKIIRSAQAAASTATTKTPRTAHLTKFAPEIMGGAVPAAAWVRSPIGPGALASKIHPAVSKPRPR